ncbi:MAG: 2-C-methyl-D-erythritol 2,4-cyclodiphosphate synthase, partial [Thermomicrobiales bacterium]
PQFKDADSRKLLEHARLLVEEAGYRVVNIDATVIAEAPKINPHAGAMRAAIAAACDVTVNDISVKATTNEGMGFVGREEGIAAMAIATITTKDNA